MAAKARFSEPAEVGARGFDSLQFSQGGTAAQAAELAKVCEVFIGYLGAMTPARLQIVLDAGMAFMPVTFGGAYENGPLDELEELRRLEIPAGTTVWLDLEGLAAYHQDPALLISKINAWADAIAAAGYMPGLYVGSPQPLTSEELWQLRVQRYWRGQGRIVDRHGPYSLAEPKECGWCMFQDYPSVDWSGVHLDVDMIGQDYRARVPAWCRQKN